MVTFTLTPQLIGYSMIGMIGLSIVILYVVSLFKKEGWFSGDFTFWSALKSFGTIAFGAVILIFGTKQIIALCQGHWFFWQ